MDALLSELTFWHWLALGIVLFGIEMMTGTFDLLMIAVAAWMTAVFAAFAPEAMQGWQTQVLVFFGASLALFALGRTVFSRFRKDIPDHPTLNRRMDGLVGTRGEATDAFKNGNGQVKLGDTVWIAESMTGETINAGESVVVDAVRGTLVIVRKV
jgi:inner membrane protein